MNHLPTLKGFSQSLFGKITVKSVQNSHIWLMGIFILFIVISAWLKIPTWIIICFVLILFILTGYYLYRDNYFMNKHPEYLRSETFQLQKKQLEMMGTKANELSAQVVEAEPITEKPKERRRKKEIKGGPTK